MGGDRRHVDAGGQCSWPTPEGGHPRASAVGSALLAAHASAPHRPTGGRAVVGGEDEHRVVGDPPFVEFLDQPPHVRVDVLDHAEERGDVGPRRLPVGRDARRREFWQVGRVGAGRRVIRGMRCVRGDGTEEWLAFLPLGVHPRQCLVEKDVGAIALRLHEPAVAADDGIVIGVARGIAAAAGIALPDAAAAVNKDPIEAPLPRLVGILITEMPLAEDAGRVAAGPPQQLRQRHGRQRQPLALEDRMGDTRTKLMAAGHERGPRRRAGRAHVKFSEPHALIAKPIEVGRVDDRIAMRGDVAIALVVGHHVDDVRPLHRR